MSSNTSMSAGELLYEGKAKEVYATDDPTVVRQYFKDDATAFNAAKVGNISGKGEANARISAHLFGLLESEGILTQMIEFEAPRTLVTKRLKMLQVEVVVRNIAAGSLANRLGYEEGTPLKKTIVEFYYKDDDLGDPLLTDAHIDELGLLGDHKRRDLEHLALRINEVLCPFFESCSLQLVDYKLEFGLLEGRLILGDEISPDTCRLWDLDTGEKLDKDRFRRDMGGVEEAYAEVLRRVEAAA